MVDYKVLLSSESKKELKNIYYWIKENESETIALKVRTGLIVSIEKLSRMPERHGIVHEISDSKITYRRILKWSYKIIFLVNESDLTVFVIDIIHSKRSPQFLKNKFGK